MPALVNTLPGRRSKSESEHRRSPPTSHPRGKQPLRFLSDNSALLHQPSQVSHGTAVSAFHDGAFHDATFSDQHKHSTNEVGYGTHQQSTVGPIPATPPISSALFSPAHTLSSERVGIPVVNMALQPAGLAPSFPTTESLQPFLDTMSTWGSTQMKIRVIEDKTTQPVQPQSDTHRQRGSFCPAPVQSQASNSKQLGSFSHVPVAGGIACTENVEERRKVLAQAAEKRMNEAMESLTVTDDSTDSAETRGSVSSDASSICPGEIKYETLCDVTCCFDERPFCHGKTGRKLGQGSFGSVYYGEMEIEGGIHQVAVKRLLNQVGLGYARLSCMYCL